MPFGLHGWINEDRPDNRCRCKSTTSGPHHTMVVRRERCRECIPPSNCLISSFSNPELKALAAPYLILSGTCVPEIHNYLRPGPSCPFQSVSFHLFGRDALPHGFICRTEKDILKFYTAVVNRADIAHVIYAHPPRPRRTEITAAARGAAGFSIDFGQVGRGSESRKTQEIVAETTRTATSGGPSGAQVLLSLVLLERNRRRAWRTQYCAP